MLQILSNFKAGLKQYYRPQIINANARVSNFGYSSRRRH